MPRGGRRIGAGRKPQPARKLRHIRASDAVWQELRRYASELKARPTEPPAPESAPIPTPDMRPGLRYPCVTGPEDRKAGLWTHCIWQAHHLAVAHGMPRVWEFEWQGSKLEEDLDWIPASDYDRSAEVIALVEDYMNARYPLEGFEWAISDTGFGLWPRS